MVNPKDLNDLAVMHDGTQYRCVLLWNKKGNQQMGLSSSQARLLTLTARMHQIEYKAAKLEAQKLQMANESRQVYEEYLNALDMTKVQMKTINNTGAISYIDATYNNLIAAGYKIDFIDPSYAPANTTSAKLLKPITQVTDLADIHAGYTAINSVEDLRNINNNPSGNYILMADIDLSGIGWIPLDQFSGVLDGNGHVIKNLTTINNAGNPGLFSGANNAEIKNLGIENVNINGNVASGICCSSSDTTIENCYISGGTIQGQYPSGGLIGYCGNTITIKDSYTNVNVISNNTPDYGGYICGYGFGATINSENSYYVDKGDAISNLCTGGATSISEADLQSMLPETSGIEYDIDYKNSTEWLTNMINAGAIIISKPDSKGNFFETSVAIDTGLQEVPDETLLRKAEAKYEADMRKIDAKDRKYDMDLAAIDNERNAIKSEMETLKTVAKDNVERTFKLFS